MSLAIKKIPFPIRLARRLGRKGNGIRGIDRILRLLHHPDHRAQWHYQARGKAIGQGPEYHLATRFFTEWTVFFYGTQDRKLHRWIHRSCQKDWVSLDVGANFGFYSLLLAQRGGECHSFEPVGLLAGRLRENIALNRFDNIHLNQTAVGNQIGEIGFYLPPSESANWGVGGIVSDQGGGSVKVPITTLDAYVFGRSLPRVDFIKIDVEGAEDSVLAGARETLQKYRPWIIFENNDRSRPAAIELLQECDYKILSFPDRRCERAENILDGGDLLAGPNE